MILVSGLMLGMVPGFTELSNMGVAHIMRLIGRIHDDDMVLFGTLNRSHQHLPLFIPKSALDHLTQIVCELIIHQGHKISPLSTG